MPLGDYPRNQWKTFADAMFRPACTRRRQRAPALDHKPAPVSCTRITNAFKRQAAQAGVPPYLGQVASAIATQHRGDGAYPCGARRAVGVNSDGLRARQTTQR